MRVEETNKKLWLLGEIFSSNLNHSIETFLDKTSLLFIEIVHSNKLVEGRMILFEYWDNIKDWKYETSIPDIGSGYWVHVYGL